MDNSGPQSPVIFDERSSRRNEVHIVGLIPDKSDFDNLQFDKSSFSKLAILSRDRDRECIREERFCPLKFNS